MKHAAEALRAEAIAAACERVAFTTDEFTSVCPRTGQPDYYSVTIDYSPSIYGLESKSLKHYLWAFRDVGIFAESLAVRIARDVAKAISPRCVTVEVRQRVRGGIALVASHTEPSERSDVVVIGSVDGVATQLVDSALDTDSEPSHV